MIRNLLDRLAGRKQTNEEETELVNEVRVEREKLTRTQTKARRALAEFYRADDVLRGNTRGGTGA